MKEFKQHTVAWMPKPGEDVERDYFLILRSKDGKALAQFFDEVIDPAIISRGEAQVDVLSRPAVQWQR